MNIKAKVNISHIDSTEHHDIYKDGQLELVERPDGTYLVQVILEDWCAAAIVDKATFDTALSPQLADIRNWIESYKPPRGGFNRLNEEPFVELEGILESRLTV